VESTIESGHKPKLLHGVGSGEEIHNMWHFGLAPARYHPAEEALPQHRPSYLRARLVRI
jgi:hypothetical protein